MQANLNRLTDLTAELRRQLKPLGRQAEVARRAAGIQADLRDARLRLLADDLATLRDTLDREIADETALRERREEVEDGRSRGPATGWRSWRPRSPADAPVLAEAQETWYQLSALQERFRSLHQLAGERLRHLPPPPRTSGPAATRSSSTPRPTRSASRRRSCATALADDQDRLPRRWSSRPGAGAAARRGRAGAGRRRQGHRRPAGGAGQADRPGRCRAQSHGRGRRGDRAARRGRTRRPQARADQAQEEYELAAGRARPRPTGTTPTSNCGTARRRSPEDAASAVVRQLADTERAAEKDAAQWKAREEALALGLRRKDGAGALLARADAVPGLLGSVAALLTVEPGYEAALAAALGALADAVAVSGVDEAVAAMRLLKDDGRRPGRDCWSAVRRDHCRPRPSTGRRCPRAPAGRWTWCGCPAELRPALHRALPDVVFAPTSRPRGGSSRTPRAARRHPRRRRARGVRGGRRLGKQPSFIEVQAAVEEARANRIEAEQRVASCGEELAEAREEVARRQGPGRRRGRRQARGREPAQRRRPAAGRAGRGAPGRRAPRPTGSPARQRQGPGRAGSGLAGLAELEERLRWPQVRPDRHRALHRGTGRARRRRCRRPGRTRWRSGSPCVPPRSGSARSPAGPTRWPARPPPSGPRGNGPRPGGPPAHAGPGSPAPSWPGAGEALAQAGELADSRPPTPRRGRPAPAPPARRSWPSTRARPSTSPPSWSG